MPRSHAYPPDLAQYVESHWPAERALRLPRELLCEALSVGFQASLTSEEARPTRFRLLLTPPDQLPESGVPNQGVLRLPRLAAPGHRPQRHRIPLAEYQVLCRAVDYLEFGTHVLRFRGTSEGNSRHSPGSS